MTMPCSVSSRRPGVERRRRRPVGAASWSPSARRSGSTTRQPATPSSTSPGGPAQRRQPFPHPVGPRGHVLADGHDQADPAGDVRLAGLEGPQRRHALGLGQHRGELGGDRRAGAEHPDAARPGQPLARGAVDDVRAEVGVGVAERLGGVEHQRDAGLAAQRGDLGGGLEQAAVAGDVDQVHEGRRVVASSRADRRRRRPGRCRRPAAAPGAARRRAAGRRSARTPRAGRPPATRPAAASR